MSQAIKNPPETQILSLLPSTIAVVALAQATQSARRGDHRHALDLLRSLHDSFEPLPSSLILLGKIHAQLGEYDKAIESWKTALLLSLPDSADRPLLENAIHKAQELASHPRSLVVWRNYRNALTVTFALMLLSIVLCVVLAVGLLRQGDEIMSLRSSLIHFSERHERDLIESRTQLQTLRNSLSLDVNEMLRKQDMKSQQNQNRLLNEINDWRREQRQDAQTLRNALVSQSEEVTKIRKALKR